jgi:hypothetical protein
MASPLSSDAGGNGECGDGDTPQQSSRLAGTGSRVDGQAFLPQALSRLASAADGADVGFKQAAVAVTVEVRGRLDHRGPFFAPRLGQVFRGSQAGLQASESNSELPNQDIERAREALGEALGGRS